MLFDVCLFFFVFCVIKGVVVVDDSFRGDFDVVARGFVVVVFVFIWFFVYVFVFIDCVFFEFFCEDVVIGFFFFLIDF